MYTYVLNSVVFSYNKDQIDWHTLCLTYDTPYLRQIIELDTFYTAVQAES